MSVPTAARLEQPSPRHPCRVLGQRGDVGTPTRRRHDLLRCASGYVVVRLRSCRKVGSGCGRGRSSRLCARPGPRSNPHRSHTTEGHTADPDTGQLPPCLRSAMVRMGGQCLCPARDWRSRLTLQEPAWGAERSSILLCAPCGADPPCPQDPVVAEGCPWLLRRC